MLRFHLRTIWALLGLCVFSSSVSAFDISYQYSLLKGKKVELCRHMLTVYKKSFLKPWNGDWIKSRTDNAEEYWRTLYAHSPSSPEFDAIIWTAHPFKVEDNSHSALYAEFDIDNDGVKDLVIHDLFFNGSPGSWDSFSVFTLGSVRIDDFVTYEDFHSKFVPHRKAVLGYSVHQRPFIYRGKAYIHGYIYTPRDGPSLNPSEPFAPPEYFTISEYLGGNAPDSIKMICEYSMTQIQR